MFNKIGENQCGIYIITNLINDKVYVGSTINKYGIYKRMYEHLYNLRKGKHINEHLQSAWNLYGEENFNFEILEIVDTLEMVNKREEYFIEYYKSYNREYGYNICRYSNTVSGYTHTLNTLIKLSGRKNNEESKKRQSIAQIGKISSKRVKIIQLSKSDEIIKIWDSMGEVEKELKIGHSKVSLVCNGIRKSAGGFKWKYFNESHKPHIRENRKIIQRNIKTNEIIKIWDSIGEASRKLDINFMGIKRVCDKVKEKITSGGYKWEYSDEIVNKKQINQKDKDGNLIKRWDSEYDAAKELSISVESIQNVLKNKGKTAGKFKWEYCN
jgi:group I intron endonuclease